MISLPKRIHDTPYTPRPRADGGDRSEASPCPRLLLSDPSAVAESGFDRCPTCAGSTSLACWYRQVLAQQSKSPRVLVTTKTTSKIAYVTNMSGNIIIVL